MSVYGTNNTNIKGNVNVSIDGSGAKFNTIYGMYGGMLGGRADIDIKNCAAGYTTCGMNSVSFSQTQPEEEGTYTYTVNMENITMPAAGYMEFQIVPVSLLPELQ